jgi:Restriction endonuclease
VGEDWKVAKGTTLEDIVAGLLRGWGFDTQTRVRAKDRSGVEHEIDVLGKKKEAFGDFTLAVECKNHFSPIDIKEIRNFNDKLSSLGYSKGLFVSAGGFTPPAMQYASSIGIETWDSPRLSENLEKARSTAELVTSSVALSSEFDKRVFPPLANASKLDLESTSVRYSPLFFVSYHCFTQQWVNFQLTNLESRGLVVIDATSGEIADVESQSGIPPQLNQSRDYASCEPLPSQDIPKKQAEQRFREVKVVTPHVTESQARQKVQLEVAKNLSQTYTYSTGRGKYVRTESKTVRPKVSEVSILSAKLVNVPIATVTLRYRNARFERTIQAATIRILKDDFWLCTVNPNDRRTPKSICEECGRLACESDGRACQVCRKMLCVDHAVSKGLIQKKYYCKEHVPVKA